MKVALQLTELYGQSPCLVALYERWGRRLSVPGACLAWALVQAALFSLVCWLQGTLFYEANRLNLVQDTTAQAYFVLLPLCYLLLYFSLRLFQRYLNGLPAVLDASAPPDAHDTLLATARHFFSADGMRRVRLVFFAIGLTVATFNAVANYLPETFYGVADKWDGRGNPVTYLLMRLYVFLTWGYLIPIWASTVYMQLRVMVRLNVTMAKHGWLRVSPLAPDQFGGLGSLAEAASWIGYLIFAAGAFFLAPALRTLLWDIDLHVGNYVGLGIYLLFVVIGTFGPVYLLHRVLSRKRETTLRVLSEVFAGIQARVDALLAARNFQGLGEENLQRSLATVDCLHRQWQALPIWPLTLDVGLRFLAAVVVPAVSYFAIQQLLKGVSS